MYKIFINDNPIFLTSRKEDITSGSVCIPMAEADMKVVVKMAQKNPDTGIFLYHPKPDKLLKKLNKKLPLVVAAGGMVKDKKGRVLFIKRNGRWDLPKGGVERGETIEEAAIRETREETGVTGLRIIRPLAVTRHIFNRNSRMKLKETHWFAMETDFSGHLKPQKSEGIKKVRWKKPKSTRKALKNAYGNIVGLFGLDVRG